MGNISGFHTFQPYDNLNGILEPVLPMLIQE